MFKLSDLRKIYTRSLPFFLLLSGIFYRPMAYNVTIDADGNADYKSLDVVVKAIKNGVIDPDTVLFIGDDQDTYIWSEAMFSVHTYKGIGEIVFMSTQTDPDLFPIINHISGDTYHLFNKTASHFQRIILTGKTGFDMGQDSPHTFQQCIFMYFDSYFVLRNGGRSNLTIENCLFAGNTSDTIFSIYHYTSTVFFTITNCTFDNNSIIFNTDPSGSNISNYSFKNNIFSNNNITFVGKNLRGKTSYSLTSEALAGYNMGCVSDPDPSYVVKNGKNPSDWKLNPNSPAASIGTSTGAPAIDIAGNTRGNTIDAGCFAFSNGPPKIMVQPYDISAIEGGTAIFSITASGIEPLSYSWFNKNYPENVLGTNREFSVSNVTAADKNSIFYCVVSNNFGSVTSKNARLKVILKPRITLHPRDTTIVENETATFSVEVTGDDLSYKWLKNDIPMEDTDSVLNVLATRTKDGNIFKCVVSNIVSSDTSNGARLKVIDAAPKFFTQPVNVTVTEGNPASFSVAAYGKSPLIYRWYQSGVGGSIGSGVKFSIDRTKISDSGAIFFCVVSNSYGKDTSAYARLIVKSPVKADEIFNPLMLMTQFIDRNHVSIKINNYSSLPFTPGTSPYTDTIGIWYNVGKFLTVPDKASSNLIKIPLLQILNSGYSLYDTTLSLNPGPQECFSYYFSGSVFWHNPDSIPDFVIANGCSTFMCSNKPLDNPLKLFAVYNPGSDSLLLTISDLTNLNRDSIAYLVSWYGNSAMGFTFDTIYPADLTSDQFKKVYKDYRFAGKSQKIEWNLYIRGILGNYSDTVKKDIEVGITGSINKAVLFIENVESTQVELSWTLPPTDQRDSVRILWGTEEIPIECNFNLSKFKLVTFTRSVKSTSIKHLEQQTIYWFGLQLYQNGLWSNVSADTRKKVTTTKSTDTIVIPNKILLKSLNFDISTNNIQINWVIDTTGIGGQLLETGIMWSTGTYLPNRPNTLTGRIIAMKNPANTYELLLDLKNDLLFDTTYYFSLWLRNAGGNWSKPTTSSSGSLIIPHVKWQAITYFNNCDTISVLNQTVKLWRDSSWPSSFAFHDTIDIISTCKIPKGFIPSSKCINFRKDNSSPYFYLGMRYDSIPAPYKFSDINMYQFDSARSNWTLVEKSGADSLNSTVFCLQKLSENKNFFILMIDTLEPVITILSDTATEVLPSHNINVKTVVSDNISNFSIKFWCGKGADTLSLVKSKSALSYTDTNTFIIPSEMVTENSGVRAFLKVTDGRSSCKIDVSRDVLRTASDYIVTKEMVWHPVAPTAVLRDSSAEGVFDELCKDGSWNYDINQFRIFRWLSHSDNAIIKGNWVEYSSNPDIKQLFNLIPGRVIWIKTRKSVLLNMGAATTVSLKAPFSISVKANAWTDFALPFKFNIRINDILNETGLNPQERKLLWLFAWNNTRKKNLVTLPVYFPILSEFSDPGKDLEYVSNGAFSIFNSLDHDITLKIPPTPISMSTFSESLPKQKMPADWSVTLHAQTENEAISPVYCGYTPAGKGKTIIPAAPTFGNVKIFIEDDSSDTWGGHMVYHEYKNGGCAFPLTIENKSSAPVNIDYSLKKSCEFPAQMEVSLFNPSSSGGIEDKQSLHLASGEKEHRWLLVGNADFLANWTDSFKTHNFALLRLYPNPCRGNLMIRFSIPYSGVNKIRIAIFDQLGRSVWSKSMINELKPGINTTIWNPDSRHTASGTYILQLSSYNDKGEIIGTKNSILTYIP